MLVGLLVLVFIIGPIIYLIALGIGGMAAIGISSSADKQMRKNLDNRHQILSQVFDGRPVATIVTGGGNLPFETVMEDAPRYGYRFISHDNNRYGILTCVFERVYNPTVGQAGY